MGEQRERPKRWAESKGGRRWWNPLIVFIWFEWCCEWIAYWLSRWAFISILGYLGRLVIVLALVSWIVEIPERKQAQEIQRKGKIYQAWQVINTAQGKTGSGGRHEALRDLIDEGESLAHVDLSQANLSGADLSGADLARANLSGAKLFGVDLTGAILFETNFSGASLGEANLSKIEFFMTDFSGASLNGADLSGADLSLANFSGASLAWANLSEAEFGGDLSGADLSRADLRGLRNWRRGGNLRLANVFYVKNPPDGFVKWAIGKGAVWEGDEGLTDLMPEEEGRNAAKNEKRHKEHGDRE